MTTARRWAVALLLAWCAAPQAAEVSMAFGEKIPPFCFPETDAGIELEVIGEALAYRGHRLKPRYFSFVRVPLAFKDGQVDAAMTDLGQDLAPFGGHYGAPAVFYDNVFITLARRKLAIRKPADLDGLSVVAFPGAAKRYPNWLGRLQKDGRYHEQNDQSLQVLTLNMGRYDVVLSDRNIYRYFARTLEKEGRLDPKPVTEHAFVRFKPDDYRPVFRDARVRDDFNAGLEALKKSGRLKAIYAKYLGPEGTPD